jgi:hypothetical protein
VRVRQLRDSGIEITLFPAFAEAGLKFLSEDGETVNLLLDIESAIKVVSAMDDRASIQQLEQARERSRPGSTLFNLAPQPESSEHSPVVASRDNPVHCLPAWVWVGAAVAASFVIATSVLILLVLVKEGHL